MYTLLTALGMGAGYALLRVLDARAPRARRGWWLALVLAALAALYTHYFAAFLLVALALFFLASVVRRRAWLLVEGIGATVLVTLGYLPWLPNLLRRFGEDASYWRGALKLDEALRHTAISFAVGETMLEQPATLWAGVNLALVVLAVALLVWATYRRPQCSRPRGLWFSLTYLLLPVVAILLLAAANPKFNPRYLMLASPGLLLLLAGGMAVAGRLPAFRKPARYRLLLALFLPLLAGYIQADRNWFVDPAFTKDDWRAAVQFIAAQQAVDEAVVLVSGHAYPAWRYYAPDRTVIRLPASETLDVNAVLDLRVADELNAALAGKQGAWLVQWQDEVVDPGGVVPFLLEQISQELPVDATFWGLARPRHFRWTGNADFAAAAAAMQPVTANFAGQVALTGWMQAACGRLVNDPTCPLYLTWRALTPMQADLKLTATLVDAEGHEWGRVDQRLAAYGYPTFRWPLAVPQLGTVLPTSDPGTPPTTYRLRLGVYDATSGRALDLLDAAGNPAGQTLWLEPVRTGLPPLPAIPIQPPAESVGKPVALLQASVTPLEAEAGQLVLAEPWWRLQQQNLSDAVVAWQWFDPAGVTQAQGTLEPFVAYPTTQWLPNMPLRSQLTLRVPLAAQKTPGVWRVQLQLVARDNPALAVSNALTMSVTIHTSTRLFEPPPLDVALDHDLAGQITLLGLDLPAEPLRAGVTVPITVAWQAVQTVDTSYTGFIHLLAAGRVAAQDDHLPQQGQTLTSAWLPGEVVLDPYMLTLPADLPAGAYPLEIGLYDASAPGLPRLAAPATVTVTIGAR